MKRLGWSSLLMVVMACAAANFAQAQDEKKDSKSDAAAQAAPQATPQPKITLLEAGTGEKSQLRYSFAKDTAATMTMTMDMRMAQSMGAMTMPPMKLPTMKMVASITVTQVHDNGDASYNFEFTEMSTENDSGVMPQVAEAVKTSMESMKGMKGQARVSNRGIVQEAKFDLPKGAERMAQEQWQAMRQSMNHFAAPMPEEPVGNGAKWKVETPLNSQGITSNQEIICTLLNKQGKSIELKLEFSQKADPQDVNHPDMPQGMTARLKSMNGKGEGTSQIQLDSPVPSEAQLKSTVDQEMDIDMGGQAMTMSQKIDMDVKMKHGTPTKEESKTTNGSGADTANKPR